MVRQTLERWLNRIWYESSIAAYLLWPFSALFYLLSSLRRLGYRSGWLRVHKLTVPVVVVGNITVGGSGKTPVVIALVEKLMKRGIKAAVVSRGYGGGAASEPQLLTESSDAAEVGDEPLLIARRTGVDVVVCSDRVAAGQMAVQRGAQVIVADDGLQHYRLHRDVEVAVVDGARKFGNGFVLPAGPLRERVSRMQLCDLIVTNGGALNEEAAFALQPDEFRSLSGSSVLSLADAQSMAWVAIAAIAHPQRFFDTLSQMQIQHSPISLPDHAPLAAYPVEKYAAENIVMTEKDAIKLSAAGAENLWYLPVSVVFNSLAEAEIEALLDKVCAMTETH